MGQRAADGGRVGGGAPLRATRRAVRQRRLGAADGGAAARGAEPTPAGSPAQAGGSSRHEIPRTINVPVPFSFLPFSFPLFFHAANRTRSAGRARVLV